MKEKVSNCRILITGGAGFIGSNLVEYFLQQSNEVVCLDNFSTGKKENIIEFIDSNKFKLIEGDIRELTTCKQACNNIDYVFHEAALGSVPRSVKDPIATTEVNIIGTLNMLVAARDCKVKRFIYAASSSSYGNSETLPKVENTIGRLLSPYAITKYANELYAEFFSNLYGLEAVGLRYFNAFGRRQDPSGVYAAVIPKFINAMIKHERPVINGDGTFSRDFTYIDNIIQANELAALTLFSNLSSDNYHTPAIFNIACGQRTTLNDLFYMLKNDLSLYDSEIAKIKPIYEQIRNGDIPHSMANISKARNLLGYTPEYNVNKGLEETIKWYWKNREKVP